MRDLMHEPEILPSDREKGQLLTEEDYVSNIHLAIGAASMCWTQNGVYDTEKAIRIANELCAYFRTEVNRAKSGLTLILETVD